MPGEGKVPLKGERAFEENEPLEGNVIVEDKVPEKVSG